MEAKLNPASQISSKSSKLCSSTTPRCKNTPWQSSDWGFWSIGRNAMVTFGGEFPLLCDMAAADMVWTRWGPKGTRGYNIIRKRRKVSWSTDSWKARVPFTTRSFWERISDYRFSKFRASYPSSETTIEASAKLLILLNNRTQAVQQDVQARNDFLDYFFFNLDTLIYTNGFARKHDIYQDTKAIYTAIHMRPDTICGSQQCLWLPLQSEDT